MKKLKFYLYNFFRVRTTFYIISKKINIFFSKKKYQTLFNSEKKNQEFLYLLSNGMISAKKIIDKTIIENWVEKYNIKNENFIACEGNISFPFYNNDLHNLLFNSDFLDYLNSYYELVYGKKPVLQTMPTLVVTKPDMNQSGFSTSKHNFPAVWHTDYLTEFTIHIPLVNINNKTNHTKYLLKSHTNFFPPPVGATKVDEINNINCFADIGDALFIDVDGWHRGHLEKGSFRAMIQLKYTIGSNELIFDPNDSKVKKALERTSINTKSYDSLKNVLKKDYEFFKRINPDLNSPHAKIFLKKALEFYSYNEL